MKLQVLKSAKKDGGEKQRTKRVSVYCGILSTQIKGYFTPDSSNFIPEMFTAKANRSDI